MIAFFEGFEISITKAAAKDMSGPGAADESVAFWASRIRRPKDATPEALRSVLKEYGAWDATQLDNDADNWERILWIAASDIIEARK